MIKAKLCDLTQDWINNIKYTSLVYIKKYLSDGKYPRHLSELKNSVLLELDCKQYDI